jgi:hypothetical protein
MNVGMQKQAFEFYEEALDFERRGQFKEALDKIQSACAFDVNNKDYLAVYERISLEGGGRKGN